MKLDTLSYDKYLKYFCSFIQNKKFPAGHKSSLQICEKLSHIKYIGLVWFAQVIMSLSQCLRGLFN